MSDDLERSAIERARIAIETQKQKGDEEDALWKAYCSKIFDFVVAKMHWIEDKEAPQSKSFVQKLFVRSDTRPREYYLYRDDFKLTLRKSGDDELLCVCPSPRQVIWYSDYIYEIWISEILLENFIFLAVLNPSASSDELIQTRYWWSVRGSDPLKLSTEWGHVHNLGEVKGGDWDERCEGIRGILYSYTDPEEFESAISRVCDAITLCVSETDTIK